jgi:hypothetical protein
MTKLALLLALPILLASAPAAADTMVLHGAAITTPDDWSMKTDNGVATLLPPDRGHFVEVYRFRAMPAADTAAIAGLFAKRPETSDVAIADVRSGKRGAVVAHGTAKIRNLDVAVGFAAYPIKQHVLVVVSFIDARRAKSLRPIHDAILDSPVAK